MINNKLSFTANIRFVSKDEFNEVTAHHPRDWSNSAYIGYPYNKTVSAKECLTDKIYSCSAGGIKSSEDADMVMFHYAPNGHADLENDVNSQLNPNGKKHGILIGGKVAQSSDMNSVNGQSIGLKNKIEAFFNKLRASYSMLWGQTGYGSNSNIFYRAKDDTWFISLENEDCSYKNRIINSADDVKKAYFYTKIDDDDHVFIGKDNQQEIDKIELFHEFRKIDGGYELDYSERNPFAQTGYGYSTIKEDDSKKVKIYCGNFGQDKSTLWIDSSKNADVQAVIDNIDRIKQGNLFKNVTKIQYCGNETVLD